MGFLKEHDLKAMGFKSIGKNVLISDKASFYSPETISIGSNVRIDDFSILSGQITLGSYIHISAYCGLYGRGEIVMQDFSGISPRCTLFSASDDFSGDHMIGPMVSNDFTNVQFGKIEIGKYAQIGAGSVILPNITISEGSIIGAMSLVKKSTDKWKIYGGTPVRFIKDRKRRIIELSNLFLSQV